MAEDWTQERIVRLLLDAARAYRERGDLDRVENWLREAAQLAATAGGPSLQAAVRASQGALERTKGNLDVASDHLTAVIDMRRRIDDSAGVARALGDLGRVHLDAGRFEQAFACTEESAAIIERVEPGRGAAEALEAGADVQEHAGHSDRAIAYLIRAEEIYRQLGDRAAAVRVGERLQSLGRAGDPRSLDMEVDALEELRLLAALEAEHWNQSRAARRLGVTETRVRNLMRKHGLRSRNRRGRPRKTPTESDR